jgi:hypothetical protein
MQNIKTLYEQPLVTSDTAPPTTIQVLVPVKNEYVGGALGASHKKVTYILFDVLSDELKQRVVTAIQAVNAGM